LERPMMFDAAVLSGAILAVIVWVVLFLTFDT
jgi:hypothetical protein